MSQEKLPSKEDFARAKAAMRKIDQGLSEVCDRIMDTFKSKGLHDVYVFYSPRMNSFGAIVFYRWNRQIEEAEKSGLAEDIKNAVFKELEKVGRGDRNTIRVDFEFDSHENVERNFDGNYDNRLR